LFQDAIHDKELDNELTNLREKRASLLQQKEVPKTIDSAQLSEGGKNKQETTKEVKKQKSSIKTFQVTNPFLIADKRLRLG
jgi:hypothetical protein